MTDRFSNVHELHPPKDRLALRRHAAELLIQATDPAEASAALFDLIAAKLKLNAMLLYLTGDNGRPALVAHRGLSEAEAALAATQDLRSCSGGGGSPAPIPLTGHLTAAQELEGGATFLSSLGLKAWFGHPLMAGDRLLGVLGFGRRWADRFHDDDLALLQTVTHYFGLALERLRGETALRESEERLRLSLAVGRLYTFDSNLLTGQVFMSPEVLARLGLPPDQRISHDQLLDTVYPADRERVIAARLASLAPDGTGDFDQEFRVKRADGAVRWMHVRTCTFFAGEGSARRAVRVIGAQRDITKSKVAEQRLRDSAERLRLALEAAGLGTFDYDVEHGTGIWSPELRAIYGLRPNETLELEKVSRQVHAEDRDLFLAPVFAARPCGDSEDYSSEFRILRTDGEMRWLAVRARQLFESGSEYPKRIIGVSWDITEQKLAAGRLLESERRLQLAQEMGGVASLEWNQATDETWVSESYRRIFGLPPGTVVNSAVFEAQLHPDDRERVIRFFTEIAEEAETLEIEYRIIRPDDQKVRWIYSTMGVVRDPVTRIIRLFGILLDITERKANEERERLLSREVDHRAKNLLSVVLGVVQLTRAETIPEFVDQVNGRIHALGRVHSLLAAARWDGAELSKLIEEELAPFANGDKRVRLKGPWVALRPAAAQSMALVIHELTTNAVKHGALSTPEGRIEVDWETGGGVAGRLVLRWRESHGAGVRQPQHLGFGLTSARMSVERQLGGTLDLSWHAEGIACELALPSRQLVEYRMEHHRPAAG